MFQRVRLLLLVALPFAAGAQVLPPPQNVVNLTASHTVEVQQDLMSIVLSATREAASAAGVQTQLSAVVSEALAQLRADARPGQMDVRTGGFSVSPRYAAGNTAIAGWRGTAEVVLEGRDFARLTQAAARVQNMAVAGISFGLTREQRAGAEASAQATAVQGFRTKAADLARSFGFTGYTLREVNVSSNDVVPTPRFRMQAAAMASPEAAAIPAEAGKTSVTVTVSGSVQLQ